MALKISSVRADLPRENDGDWIKVPGWDEVAFKVRADTSKTFRAKRDALLTRLARRSSGDEIPEDEIYQETGALLAEHILLDWKGLIGDDGGEVAYSKDRALDFMTSPEWREVRNAVERCAAEIRQTKAVFVEAASKN